MAANVDMNQADDLDFDALHALLQGAFAFMKGRIDPPSSMDALTAADLRAKARTEDLFVIRTMVGPIACLFGVRQGSDYYIGKLAVAAPYRGGGLARALIAAAETQARALGCRALILQTRVELVENHATFASLGFVQTAATAHPGYGRPTSLTFRRGV